MIEYVPFPPKFSAYERIAINGVTYINTNYKERAI